MKISKFKLKLFRQFNYNNNNSSSSSSNNNNNSSNNNNNNQLNQLNLQIKLTNRFLEN